MAQCDKPRRRRGGRRVSVAVVVLCLLAASSVVKAFTSSSSSSLFHNQQKHDITFTTTTTRLWASTLPKQDEMLQQKNQQQQKPQSARLIKAKQLLEQLSVKSDSDDFVEISRTTAATSTTSSNSDTSSSSSSKSSKKKMLTGASSSSSTSQQQIEVLVPDTFWSNGHLQGGGSYNYVTRWARGVKVAEPLVKYDPVAAEQLLFRQPAKWVLRNFQIALPLGWWAVNVAMDFIFSPKNSSDSDNDALSTSSTSLRRQLRAKQLTRAISELGPAIIKGGQALASRPDLLPSEYLQELQKLQDDVPRFSNEVAFATVEQELNVESFNSVFTLVDPDPIAAASIGQVYKAKLVENGDVVALKIQRPKCEEIIALDLYVLRWWAGIYNRIFKIFNKDIDVQSIIDDFGELIYREIDYVAEASNAQRFNELYAGITDVFVPKIYSDFTTSKVLTMEWVDGFRLTDDANMNLYNLNKSKMVDTLVQCSLKQILENGFFHADPHAGNLLACPDGRLCYLDFGMMSYADTNQRNGFLLAVVHVVNRDWESLVRLYQKLGFIPPGTDLRPIELALERALPEVLNAEVSELNIKNIFSKLGDIMYTYPFSLPPFYIAIIRCLGVLEGLAIQVDPQARVVKDAYPYVASRVLTDPQDELQEALRRLALTNDGRAVRWERLEGLLDQAKQSAGYDVTAALDVLTDYLISDDYNGDALLADLSNQIVNAADSLGSETIKYILEASRALSIKDEVGAVRAFRSLQQIISSGTSSDSNDNSSNGQSIVGGARGALELARRRVNEDLQDVLPEPTPAMKRFGRIVSLLADTNGNNDGSSSSKSMSSSMDPAKLVPIVRKLAQEPKIQRVASETLARLGERVLSRGLRAVFGLPPPLFGSATSTSSGMSTVTEDDAAK